jgi:Tetratricopeptide repeat
MHATLLAVSALLVWADRPAIPWRLDSPQAFADAEAQAKPALLLFRTGCGRASTPGAADALGRSVHGSDTPDCDAMEQDVWSHPDVVLAVQRFVPIQTGEGSDQTLNVRYNVVKPTLVLADPWGNEIVKLVGYTPRDRVLRILNALPRDFAPLQPAGLALRQDRERFAALTAAAAFYEAAGLREFADRYYQQAQASPDARADASARRSAVIAQGMNLMQLGKHAEAAGVFERALRQSPDGPMADALLLGRVLAEAQQGRRKDAERAFEELRRRFPDSPYTAKAREQLGGR